MALLPHHACRDVVGAESIAELHPRHLVVRGVSGGVVGSPCTSITTQLLRGKKGLLHLGAAQEPKLGLHHLKPVIGLKRLSYLREERQVSGREVAVGGRSWSGSISCPIAPASGVGHKLPQQLGLLIVELKDRGDRLSQSWWRWRRIPVSLGVLRPNPSIASVHHSFIQHVTIILGIKLSNIANLSNGKGDNSTITENHGKLCLDRIVNTIFKFSCPYGHNQIGA
jgi:hypothetical protein